MLVGRKLVEPTTDEVILYGLSSPALHIGNLAFLNWKREQTKKIIAWVEQTMLARQAPVIISPSGSPVQLLPGAEPELKPVSWISIAGPTQFAVWHSAEPPSTAPIPKWVRRVLSHSLREACSALNAINKSIKLLMEALRETCSVLSIVVTRQASFAIHGFHPPAPSVALAEDALLWRGCAASS